MTTTKSTIRAFRPIGAIPKPRQKPRTILSEAASLVGGDRRKAYGDPRGGVPLRFVTMLNAVYGTSFVPRDYALILMLVKISREMHKHKRDNLVDIAGYAQVLALIVGDDE